VWMTVLGSMKWASPTFRKALALLPGSLFFFQNSLSLATQSFSSSEKIKEKQKKTRPLISFLFTSTWIFLIWSLVFSLIWNGYKLTLGGCSMFRKKFGSKNKKTNKNNLDSWERFKGDRPPSMAGVLLLLLLPLLLLLFETH
jgi:hypothetical protein